MYIPYTITLLSRDRDNYSQSDITDTGYLSDDTLEGLYQQMINICMDTHKGNIGGICNDTRNREHFTKKLEKINDKNLFDFGYASSYDSDSYIEFGDITLDSISPDKELIIGLSGNTFSDYIASKKKDTKSLTEWLDDYYKNRRKEQYLKLKSEFE